MKEVVITWGFGYHDGKPYLDSYLEVTHTAQDAHAIKMMHLRGSTQNTKLCLLRIPKECDREYVEEFVATGTPFVKELLKQAKVSLKDILREGDERQAIDFIKY